MDSHSELESSQKKWLGQKCPPQNLPPDLEQMCSLALEVPAVMRATLLPDPELDVLSFLRRTWPRAQSSATLFNRKAEMFYIKTIPSGGDLDIVGQELPSRDFVARARDHLGQALMDGSCSIIDPMNRRQRLPIWVVQYWQEAHDMILEITAAQKVWGSALEWLDAHNDDSEMMKSCHDALAQLPWSETAIAKGFATSTRTTAFARILSDHQLTTTLVDVFINIIADIVRSDPKLDETFEIVDLVFMFEINKAQHSNHWHQESRKYLRKLEDKMAATPKTLLFPMHLPERIHFVSSAIDFKKQTIAYGMLSP